MCRGGRFGSNSGQICSVWDQFRILKDQISVHFISSSFNWTNFIPKSDTPGSSPQFTLNFSSENRDVSLACYMNKLLSKSDKFSVSVSSSYAGKKRAKMCDNDFEKKNCRKCIVLFRILLSYTGNHEIFSNCFKKSQTIPIWFIMCYIWQRRFCVIDPLIIRTLSTTGVARDITRGGKFCIQIGSD